MPKSIFRGRIEKGRCTLRFHVGGAALEGVAVIDTGFPYMMLNQSFADRAGVQLQDAGSIEIAGIGTPPRKVPTTETTFVLLADEGPPFRVKAMIGVETAPEEFDLLIGMEILGAGVFTINGPAGTWEWSIDHSAIAYRIVN